MGSQHITVAVCFVALLVSCSARPNVFSKRDDHEENNLPVESPEFLEDEVDAEEKSQEFNEDEDLKRRQVDVEGLSTQASSTIVNGLQSQSNSQQLQQLKDILTLEMNNKDKFEQIYAQMNPEQVKKIRELVLRIGQQTGSQELIHFGQCKSPRFSEQNIKTLIGLGESLYERLNTETTGIQTNRAGLGDQSEIFNQMVSSISNQQEFIRRLVNMIEVQLSKAPQIDQAEFSELQDIMMQIKVLSSQVQTQLQEATDLSQLTQMGEKLLQINKLSSELQKKVSAEVIEDRLNDFVSSVSNSNSQQNTETTGNTKEGADSLADSVNIQVRDTIPTNTITQPQPPQEVPQHLKDVDNFLGGVQWYFEKLKREGQQQLMAQRPYLSKYATQAYQQLQQYPQVASTLQYMQQQYPQVNSAIQSIQQQFPDVSNAIQNVQKQIAGATNNEETTPELKTTQNADGSLTLQAEQLPEETAVQTEQQNVVDTSNVETTNTATASR